MQFPDLIRLHVYYGFYIVRLNIMQDNFNIFIAIVGNAEKSNKYLNFMKIERYI